MRIETTYYDSADSLHDALLDAAVLRAATLRAVGRGRLVAVIVTERDGRRIALTATAEIHREAAALFERSVDLVERITKHIKDAIEGDQL